MLVIVFMELKGTINIPFKHHSVRPHSDGLDELIERLIDEKEKKKKKKNASSCLVCVVLNSKFSKAGQVRCHFFLF